MKRVVVIGAGVGGLTTAAVLAKQGLNVTVLEAQVYPGGCASTYYHQGYRFDSGATLAAGFYPGGPMDLVAQRTGVQGWPVHPLDAAMVVHLPDGRRVPRWTDHRRFETYRESLGEASQRFFEWQERTAGAVWDLALRLPSWPPQNPANLFDLARTGLPWLTTHIPVAPSLAASAFRPLAALLSGASENLRIFLDAQLLISAQATSERVNALYGAAALDLPRRGVVQLSGGMGAIAAALVDALEGHGGQVLYRQEVVEIVRSKNVFELKTKRGVSYPADMLISNLTPWDTAALFKEAVPARLARLPARPHDGWGAFVVYAGLDASLLPPDLELHHQVVVRRPLGEGNTVFASLSPAWDDSRAPAGFRALTISTHTALDRWWRLFEHDRSAYESQKAEMTEKILANAETAIPGLRRAARLVMPGTPVTFQRFVRRKWGWVGGFPQTSLLRSIAPQLGKQMWLVGDSIFPGQSTTAVALGGLRVANAVLHGRSISS
jgi:C-3',4' desaturase CrtD